MKFNFTWDSSAFNWIAFWITFIIVTIIATIFNQFNIGFDDSDDWINHKRSNLIIYTDHRSGCQYMQGGFFGDNITPRMDENGKQICQKNNK
jgi:hypothetical protein